jgi:hypothetical protein
MMVEPLCCNYPIIRSQSPIRHVTSIFPIDRNEATIGHRDGDGGLVARIGVGSLLGRGRRRHLGRADTTASASATCTQIPQSEHAPHPGRRPGSLAPPSPCHLTPGWSRPDPRFSCDATLRGNQVRLDCRRRRRGPQVRQERGQALHQSREALLAAWPLHFPRGGPCARRLAVAAYHRCMRKRIGRRQPDGSAHNRHPGFADLDRMLEPVEFAAQSSVEGRAWIVATPGRGCSGWARLPRRGGPGPSWG